MPNIILHNETNAENNAMLQALYSRSADSVTKHLEKLKASGSSKFMERFYLGYGHNSIADCGVVTLYIEGVSMLCAKAIQDSPLYNGQESSSRYIDWSEQIFYNPFSTGSENRDISNIVLEKYREFYVTQKPKVIASLTRRFPIQEGEDETFYNKAITARAFDILRGFLPCGATTNLSWMTTLRKANEHLAWMALHPLEEVRLIAMGIHGTLKAEYASSIADLPDMATADTYLLNPANYYTENRAVNDVGSDKMKLYGNSATGSSDEIMQGKPARTRAWKHSREHNRLRVEVNSSIDFGSFRDIQRHRFSNVSMPLVHSSTMHPWYINNLPEESKADYLEMMAVVAPFIREMYGTENPFDMQYLLPMGTLVTLDMDMTIDQAVYLCELRTGQTVHATLREVMQGVAKCLSNQLPSLQMKVDMEPDTWTIRRGKQDIIAK